MKNSEETEEMKGNNVSFRINSKIEMDFELKIREETGF
jgi:hypothetical protein